MVDVVNLFNYSHVAIIKSTDSYGMEGVAAFSQLWTAKSDHPYVTIGIFRETASHLCTRS